MSWASHIIAAYILSPAEDALVSALFLTFIC